AADRSRERFRGLELVVTGGANLPASIRSALAAVLPDTRLISYYGAAEIGFIGDSRDGDGTWIHVYPTIGAQIRDEAGAAVAEGELGTLWIDAAACADGYVAGTTDAVLRGPDGWASVDDQGRIVNGLLQLAGRAGDIAVTGGHKVSLPEVERAFDTVPHLGEVVAIALEDANLGSVIALVIEGGAEAEPAADGSPGLPAGKAALLEHARARLAPQFVPRRIYVLERLPRTVGGKIRRSETVDIIMSGQGHLRWERNRAWSAPGRGPSPRTDSVPGPCGRPCGPGAAASMCSRARNSRIWPCASAVRCEASTPNPSCRGRSPAVSARSSTGPSTSPTRLSSRPESGPASPGPAIPEPMRCRGSATASASSPPPGPDRSTPCSQRPDPCSPTGRARCR